jgi:hypothetical protein
MRLNFLKNPIQKEEEKMKANRMKKELLVLGMIFLMVFVLTTGAFAWSAATHAYIEDHLGKKGGLDNGNEIYGGLVPDIFNYLFNDPAYLDYLYGQTHNDFLKVWNASRWGLEKSLAYGFVGHNDVWGADFTAHHLCNTCGTGEGYAIAKVRELLTIAPLPVQLGIPEDVAIEIFHEIVETSVDILVSKKTDPLIGKKIVSSAIARSPQFPLLLVKACAKDFALYAGISYFEAARFITSAEKEFRKTMILYGQVLMQDEATAIQLISEQTADAAEGFLSLYGIQLPLPKEEIIQMVIGYTTLAISICEYDYQHEIEATIHFVDQQLKGYGITY